MILELDSSSLEQLFPRLETFADAELPFSAMDEFTRNILQRAEIRTWEELGSWTAYELVSIHNMAPASIATIIRVCVEQLSATEASYGDGESSHPELQEMRRSATGEDTLALRCVTDRLQLLAAWAVRERDITRIGELFELVPKVKTAKGEPLQDWEALAAEPISVIADSELVHANIDSLAAALLNELTPTELAVYQTRLERSPNLTLAQVGQSLGLTGERVRQIQTKVEDKLEAKVRHKRFLPLLWRASDLGGTLGFAAPVDSEVTAAAFRLALRGCKNEASRLTNLLLRLAGPYRLQNGWHIRVGEPSPNWTELKELADENGILQLEETHAWFRQHGLNLAFFDDWLDTFAETRHIGDSLAIWSGSVMDKCATLLAIRGIPTDTETLVSEIGERHSVRATRQRMFDDARFMRVSKTDWALRSCDLEEYTGIADEIAQRVRDQGGRARLSKLMDEIPELFKVSRLSVRAYAEAPMFVLEDGWVRLRGSHEPFSGASDEMCQVRGLFRSPNGHINMLIPVDGEVLRGSGRQCPPALATALGVAPGASRTFTSTHSQHLTVSWPLTGLGPALGSTRSLAEAVHSTDGELLRLAFNQTDSTVDAYRIPKSGDSRSTLERLCLLTGLSDLARDPAAAIADAIGVSTSSLRTTLRQRGDTEIASLLPGPPDSPALDAALSDLASLLHESD